METLQQKALVFFTKSYEEFATRLVRAGGLELGELKTDIFPDGESYHRFMTGVEGRDVVVVGGTISDAETLELYDLASGAVSEGARKLSLVIPFFGYSTMERAVKSGEVVKAKTRARILSSLPVAASGNQVLLLDLHSEGIPHYFEGSLHPVHIYAKEVVMEAALDLAGGVSDFVLASTDAGRAKWVESLAYDMEVEAAFAYKRRVSGDTTKTLGISRDVKDKHVIIYDDMIRTGGSLIGAAKAYIDAGAKKVDVITTHGVFPENALERIMESGMIQNVVCTDSHSRIEGMREGALKVYSVAHLFVSHL